MKSISEIVSSLKCFVIVMVEGCISKDREMGKGGDLYLSNRKSLCVTSYLKMLFLEKTGEQKVTLYDILFEDAIFRKN